MQYQRLLVLLDACDPEVPRRLPKGVALKTLIEAREHGLVELYGEVRDAKGALTKMVLKRERISQLPEADAVIPVLHWGC